jgi:hypothetical protein
LGIIEVEVRNNMATRRPMHSIKEEGRLITQEEKTAREKQKQRDFREYMVLTGMAYIIVYPIYLVSRLVKRIFGV